MSELESELDKLRQALEARQAQGATSSEQARLLRFANAITNAITNTANDDHAVFQAQMPQMAEAEMRGERVSRLFPEAAAHFDLCESCSLEYAQLIDALMALEEAVGMPLDVPPPPIPQRLALVARLKGWVTQSVHAILAKLPRAEWDAFEPNMLSFMERLPTLPPLSQPQVAREMALGFGTRSAAFLIFLATWATTEAITERYTSQQIADLVAQGKLTAEVQSMADQIAKAMGLNNEQRKEFVTGYLARVQSEPQTFVALGKSQ